MGGTWYPPSGRPMGVNFHISDVKFEVEVFLMVDLENRCKIYFQMTILTLAKVF